jgi:hypothetical protein
MKGLLTASMIAALVLLGGCNRATRPTPLPGQELVVSNLLYGCPYGLERFLPGDYYFCEAGSHFWAGRYNMSRDSLESASRWGSKAAQYALGVMYFNGDHVAANQPLGVAWLAIAAERHAPEYEQTFVSAYQQLTPEQRAQADAYWRDMTPIYADKVAAVRADKRFNRAYRDLETAVAFGGGVYINGITMGVVSGLTITQRMKNERDMFFAGYDTHVWVGDAELVPLGQLPSIKKTEPAATPPLPSSN